MFKSNKHDTFYISKKDGEYEALTVDEFEEYVNPHQGKNFY